MILVDSNPTSNDAEQQKNNFECRARSTSSLAKRVRFAVDVASDESIPSILARTAEKHVLSHLGPIMTAAGLHRVRPGQTQVIDPAKINDLAWVLRVDADIIKQHMGVRNSRHSYQFEDFTIPAMMLDLRERWISPKSLLNEPHHRFSWLNRHLPYCPVSGELLTNICDQCQETLGWNFPQGLAKCEHCGSDVGVVEQPGLLVDAMDSYQWFSELWSIDTIARRAAIARLPAEIRNVDLTTLISVSLKMAALIQYRKPPTIGLRRIRSKPPQDLADEVCGAMELLAGWPSSLENGLRELRREQEGDHASFLTTWKYLKRNSTANLCGDTQSQLMLSAVPWLEGTIWRSFPSKLRTYSAQKAILELGRGNMALRHIAQHGGVKSYELPSSAKRKNVSYDADDIDNLRDRIDASVPLRTAAHTMGLPIYVIEQFVDSDLLTQAKHRAFPFLFNQVRVKRTSLVNLQSCLGKACHIEERRPSEAKRLRLVMRKFGGGEKPWAAVIKAIKDREIECWIDSDGFNLRHAYVLTNTIEHSCGAPWPQSKSGHRESTISKQDAEEILCVSSTRLEIIAISQNILFRSQGHKEVTLKTDIMKIAKRYIDVGELSERLGWPIRVVASRMRSEGFKRFDCGWSRKMLKKAGVIR